ncbi:MAG: hypothetical protein K5919_06075 [Clostridiales bacterium]|nr:hypothetical protein [Clostridiales bacterium]
MSKKIVSLLLCAVLFMIPLSSALALGDSPAFALMNTEGLIREARAQALARERTPLNPPVRYRMLWLGFTHVTYGDLDFRMNTFHEMYLRAVALNFETYVEKVTNHSIDIQIDLYFIPDVTKLTRAEGDEWLYLDWKAALPAIRRMEENKWKTEQKRYDTVITAVETAGEDNWRRNKDKPGYGINYVMGGVELRGIESDLGYSTFDLNEPFDGTYPLMDPEIPSLYGTAVAVHEWLHQMDGMGELLGIEYPVTHAYLATGEYPKYQDYVCGKNNYDYFEFYEQVLQGTVPCTDRGKVTYVGMYPKMWKLILRDSLHFGHYTITNENGEYLTAQRTSPTLTLSDRECLWVVSYESPGRVILSPVDIPEWRIDLDNGIDQENNTVKMFTETGWAEAQSWVLEENDDGSYFLHTPFPSGRVITVYGKGQPAKITTVKQALGMLKHQKWYFTRVR